MSPTCDQFIVSFGYGNVIYYKYVLPHSGQFFKFFFLFCFLHYFLTCIPFIRSSVSSEFTHSYFTHCQYFDMCNVFSLNLLGWYWLIKLYRFQVYNSITYHLYVALSVHHPKLSSPITIYLIRLHTNSLNSINNLMS